MQLSAFIMKRRRAQLIANILAVFLWTLVAISEAFLPFKASVRFVASTQPSLIRSARLVAATSDSSIPALPESKATETDNRPHEQRAKCPRPARRLNHAFKYLYRHDCDDLDDDMNATSYFLQQNYTMTEINRMNASFPPLLQLSVKRHLHPKMRFLRQTMKLQNNQLDQVPPQFFGARLEAAIAPRHALLVHFKLPHGQDLLRPSNEGAHGTNSFASFSSTLLNDFLISCRDAKRFATLCQSWQQQNMNTTTAAAAPISAQQVKAFDVLFARGLMSAARNEHQGLTYLNDDESSINKTTASWPLDFVNVTSGELVRLLILHGANPRERDRRGATLVHWAAGTGNLEGLVELLPHAVTFACDKSCGRQNGGVWLQSERDGATPLHWAVAGCNARHFGTGGHVDIAKFLLSQVSFDERQQYMDQRTMDGNSALMWAAWSGSFDCVRLLVERGAKAGGTNRNGCSLAHWATSGK
ncbi:hypothetical protein MPSEU_000136400 [Mayamaea pseudoterrestris]|nr:hypothetical protein MPSEU_000136400 [Mayamaea pseudoterrestris]